MKKLHIINNFNKPFELFLKFVSTGDSALFIEEALFLLQHNPEKIVEIAKEHKLYALKNDAEARGITAKGLPVNLIGYDIFVDLTETYEQVISWH